LPASEAAQAQWLNPQSTVPPRHSIEHIVSAGNVPAWVAPTHRSEWHIATGAQSSSFVHWSFENLGVATAEPPSAWVLVGW
jgi:hypothetical protein